MSQTSPRKDFSVQFDIQRKSQLEFPEMLENDPRVLQIQALMQGQGSKFESMGEFVDIPQEDGILDSERDECGEDLRAKSQVRSRRQPQIFSRK